MELKRTHTRREFLALSAGSLLAAGSCRSPVQEEAVNSIAHRPPNVVVFLSDTLRADHLGCYGYGKNTSPAIDALAAESLVFEQCFAPAPWTKPSVASLFTGLLPHVHQASATAPGEMHRSTDSLRVQMLRSALGTLAERFKTAGYATGYFLTNPQIQREFGFAQGFDAYTYKDVLPPTQIVHDALDWIDSLPQGQPFFAYIHEINPHAPYTCSDALFESLHGVPPQHAAAALPEGDRALLAALDDHFTFVAGSDRPPRPSLTELSPAGIAFLKQIYDGEILGVDRDVAHLVGALRERSLFENTAFVFTSDHGEEFNDHGGFFHGHTLFDELIRVPLVLKMPGQATPARIPYSAGLIDLYATLLNIASIAVPKPVQSEPLVDDTGALLIDTDRPVFAALDYYSADPAIWEYAMIVGKHKVRTRRNGNEIIVIDRERDPAETGNLLDRSGSARSHALSLVDRFRTALAEHKELAAALGPPVWSSGSEETREQLEALGYLGDAQ
jgi:arylsulfatase A-like enzyme